MEHTFGLKIKNHNNIQTLYTHMKKQIVAKLIDDIKNAETEVSWAEHKGRYVDRRRWAAVLKGLRLELKSALDKR